LVGLAAITALGLASRSVAQREENHLLNLQVQAAGSVLTLIAPTIQTPLTSAAELAAATGGNATRFTQFSSGEVGASKQFVSLSLIRYSNGQATVIQTLGSAPRLSPLSKAGIADIREATRTPQLHVNGLLSGNHPRIGYTVEAPGLNASWVVYAESKLAARRRGAKLKANSAFHELDYALYLGKSTASSNLLQTSVESLPFTGRTSEITTPFGDSSITLVATPIGQLSGWLAYNLWWLIIVFGSVISAGASATANRLIDRQQFAERIARENQLLYAQQRDVTVTLQQALLPAELPQPVGARVAVRYLPGTSGAEIGGDWYDLIQSGDHLVFVVGDVSGRGLRAATVMASLRYAIRAYVAVNDDPVEVMTKLSRLVDLERDDHFATMLYARIDVENHAIEFCNAGHPQPLLIEDGNARTIDLPVDAPIGVRGRVPYHTTSVRVAPNVTLVALTDGLIERQGEDIDTGKERLRQSAATHARSALELMLDEIVSDLIPEGSVDDVAIMGLQWQS
jgi:hypothetical protein